MNNFPTTEGIYLLTVLDLWNTIYNLKKLEKKTSLCPGPFALSETGIKAVLGQVAASEILYKDWYDHPVCPTPAADWILCVQPQPELKVGGIKPLTKKDLHLHA